MSDEVVILKNERYDRDLIYNNIVRGINLLKINIPKNKKVIIKPNIVSQNSPKKCTTTHPVVIDAICKILSENNNTIYVGESSAFYQGGYTQKGFIKSGIKKVADKYNARIICFEEDGVHLFKDEKNVILKEVILAKILKEIDYIINVPKLKTHAFFKFSGAVKNLYGFVPGGTKQEYHFVIDQTRDIFGEKLVDIYNIIRPNLNIIDAIWGLEGFGPAATGDPKKTDLMFIAENAFALDFVASKVIGYDPFEISSIKSGLKRGFLNKPESIILKGDFVTIPTIFYKKPKFDKQEKKIKKEKTFLYKFIVKPIIKKSKCKNCKDCITACPVKAITFSKHPVIDYSKCLSCYHCNYVCKENAIKLRGTWINLFIRCIRKIIGL